MEASYGVMDDGCAFGVGDTIIRRVLQHHGNSNLFHLIYSISYE